MTNRGGGVIGISLDFLRIERLLVRIQLPSFSCILDFNIEINNMLQPI